MANTHTKASRTATTDTANTNQHYVPQMLLRGFSTTPDSEQVWVFDKRTGKAFTTGIRAIAAEEGYYDLGDSAIIDAAMNRTDAFASRIIGEIRSRRSLAGISRDDRDMLAGFVVIQLLRTRGFQEGMRHMAEGLATAIAKKAGTMPPGWDEELANQEWLREEYLRVIPQFTGDFLPHLLDKDLLLFRTDAGLPFCISDNPVALNNTINTGDGIRGTLGLAVRGIEIYLPISSELTLAYICRSVGERYETIRDELWRLGGFISEDAHNYLQARDIGKALKLGPENVRFQNSLQARNAERFVISPVNEFADAADMIANHPDARVGPRATAN